MKVGYRLLLIENSNNFAAKVHSQLVTENIATCMEFYYNTFY